MIRLFMTTKYELDYLINNIISNSEKIAKLKLTEDYTSPLTKQTINKLYHKVYATKYRIMRLFDIMNIEKEFINEAENELRKLS